MVQILKTYFGSFELLAKQIRVQLTQMQNVGFELQQNMKQFYMTQFYDSSMTLFPFNPFQLSITVIL